MAKNIQAIEGIGPVYEEKLAAIGIRTVAKLLEEGKTKKGRIRIAESAGVSEKLVLTWVNHADLFRIKGIASQYAELLEAAGVDSVPELAQRKADNLAAKMQEVNDEKSLVRLPPGQKRVESWIEQAKKMERVVTH